MAGQQQIPFVGALDETIRLLLNSNATDAMSKTATGAQTFSGPVSGWTQPVIPTGATIAPTAAQSGSLIAFGATGGSVVTLPPPVVGVWFDLVITVSNTSAANEIRTNTGTVFLLGMAEHSATGIAGLDFWADGTSIQAIKMDGAHLGGLIGSKFHVVCISATQWYITGINLGTATMTTAFTATP